MQQASLWEGVDPVALIIRKPVMKGTRTLSDYLSLLAFLAGSASIVFAAVVTPVSADTDEWRVVSAPPPPGPYRTVNLDPRIPGPEGIPMIGSPDMTSRWPESTVPDMSLPPPSAGGPAHYTATLNQLPPQVPGAYQTRKYGPPVSPFSGASQYPVYTGRQERGNMPYGGYMPSQPYQGEEVVPPPPVFDAMMRAPPGEGPAGSRR